jgi:hypothetical protein
MFSSWATSKKYFNDRISICTPLFPHRNAVTLDIQKYYIMLFNISISHFSFLGLR